MVPFLDDRDKSGSAILSHVYLLLGCALPIWFSNLSLPSSVTIPLCGTFALGIGDALASTVGKAIGVTKWANRRKSVQGTLAFIIGLYISLSMVDVYSSVAISKRTLLISSTLTGLLEAFSEQNDNIVIPLYMYIVLTILQ
ncbi:hypothetical protein HDV06_005494 [Boothiomyces sp. JEL0866]|nr:hypothetical protein HDV06_005494 [Boothiomyces sp. JEL0866]